MDDVSARARRQGAGERRRCAANNVAWYEAVLAPHGIVGSVEDGMWVSRGPVPPYYSNAVTLDADATDTQVAAIRELTRSIDGPFTVKDSFARMDLSPLGFDVLFDAAWIWRDPSTSPSDEDSWSIAWRVVADDAALVRWETAWREHGSPTDTRVFLPGLLEHPDVELVAGQQGDHIVGGFALNRSADVVGVTNFFAATATDLPLGAAVIEAARFAPDRPVVGFAAGSALQLARSLGFRTVGRLRVWISQAS